MNEEKIRASSKFFDKALNAEWKEGRERTIELPESDPEAFNIYLHWLYSGKLFVKDDNETATNEGKAQRKLTRSYLIGDKLLDVDFKDAIIDAIAVESGVIRDGVRYIPAKDLRRLIYENTPPGATVRRLLIRMIARFNNIDKLVLEDDPPALLHEMVLELCKTTTRPTEKVFQAEVAACKYHEHPPGAENCYRNKRRCR